VSRLYYSESGNLVSTLCEELTSFRRARKVLHLPPTASPPTLYILARRYPDSTLPLRISVNGEEIAPIAPRPSQRHDWYQTSVAASLLGEGANTFEFWTDSSAMNAWSLAIEGGHANPRSSVSDDGGVTWRNERMAYLNVLRGEYIVRLRLAEGRDPSPPRMVWEDPLSPRLNSLKRLIPRAAWASGPLLDRVRALASWLSCSWAHWNAADSALYGPWDPETILAWGKAEAGHQGQRPVLMCVHYSVALVSCCQAAGVAARCAALKGTIPSAADGHFVVEVWVPEHAKWVMVDPTFDAVLWKDDVPLSLAEIRDAGSDLGDLIRWGPGLECRLNEPGKREAVERFVQGYCFAHRSVWPRADFLSHPEFSPSGHGTAAYCETGLVWEEADRDSGYGMFPYFGSSEYFDRPPEEVGAHHG
jgi:transglutaminase-like putative cysteine protease